MEKIDPKFKSYEKIINGAISEYGPNIRSIQKIGVPGNRPYQVEGTREYSIYTAWGMLTSHLRGFVPLDGIETYIKHIVG